MPRFESAQSLPAPLARVFDFFSRPANLVRVSPPELHFELVSAPERLQLGSRLTVKGRRWGLPQRVVTEVTAWEPEQMFVDEQREGPFRKWVHAHRFEALADGGTRVSDCIDFETPRGLLGLVVTAAAVERELNWVFEYRRQKLAELLSGPA
jgi:ligand-binding SRPBCC domain-containing protein